MFTLSDIGLLFDIAGAIVLAQGLFMESLEEVTSKRVLFWGSHDRISSMTSQQIIETRGGLSLLILGFVFQLIGGHASLTIHDGLFWAIAGALVVCCVIIRRLAISYAPKDTTQDNLRKS